MTTDHSSPSEGASPIGSGDLIARRIEEAEIALNALDDLHACTWPMSVDPARWIHDTKAPILALIEAVREALVALVRLQAENARLTEEVEGEAEISNERLQAWMEQEARAIAAEAALRDAQAQLVQACALGAITCEKCGGPRYYCHQCHCADCGNTFPTAQLAASDVALRESKLEPWVQHLPTCDKRSGRLHVDNDNLRVWRGDEWRDAHCTCGLSAALREGVIRP